MTKSSRRRPPTSTWQSVQGAQVASALEGARATHKSEPRPIKRRGAQSAPSEPPSCTPRPVCDRGPAESARAKQKTFGESGRRKLPSELTMSRFPQVAIRCRPTPRGDRRAIGRTPDRCRQRHRRVGALQGCSRDAFRLGSCRGARSGKRFREEVPEEEVPEGSDLYPEPLTSLALLPLALNLFREPLPDPDRSPSRTYVVLGRMKMTR